MKTNRFNWLFLLFGLLSGFQASAQKETNFWYFGNYAGLEFLNNTPTIKTDGKMRALEGCTAISDSLGNLLFYTAGDTVFNRFHQKMNNGWVLQGHQSASQSSVVVQNPYIPTLYYLFTIDALGGPNGLKYSTIDVAALNSKGSVLSKNFPLLSPVSEKITAVDHRYSRDAWVIVHGSSAQNDKFYAFRVTPGGVSLNPVVSQVPNAISHAGTFPSGKAIGCMKVSPDGRKLALAMQELNLVELYDFNDSSGVVSNPIRLTGLPKAYGIEFSRDGSKLYVSTQSTSVDIFQYDLEAGSTSAIITSRRTALSTKSIFSASLQLARNGRIYAASTEVAPGNRTLRVINLPDSSTASISFSTGSQPVNPPTSIIPRFSELGLPNFNQSYLWVPTFIYKKQCIGDVMEFTLKMKRKVKSVHWNFDDPDSGPANVSNLENPTHQFTKPGTYNVTLTAVLLNNRTRKTTTQIIVYPLPDAKLGPDQEICVGGKLRLSGPENMLKYTWSTGSDSASIQITKPGTYWLEITTPEGCTGRDTINVRSKAGPQIFNEKLVETCPFRYVTLKPSFRSVSYEWSNGSTDSTLTVNREGWYAVKIKDADCTFADSVQVVFKACPEDFMVPNIITPNGDDLNETFMIRGSKPGEWQLKIYNRWGVLVYEDDAYRNDWPKNAPVSGNYYYMLQNPQTGQHYRGWIEVAH